MRDEILRKRKGHGDNGYFADTYEYKKPAQKYLGSSSYRFEFTKGELSYITISYTP